MATPTTKQLDEIQCPSCGTPIPVSEALRHQLTQHVREELSGREKGLVVREKELEDREKQLGENTKEFEQRVAQEVAVAGAARQAEVEKRMQEELAQGLKKLEAEAKQRAEDAVSVEVNDMRERLREKEEQLGKAEQNELALRKRERELVNREKTLELETERRIAAERQVIEEETAKRLGEEHRLKDAEKDKKLQDAIKANEELRRKLQQGSQQTQGEVLELQIEELIRSNFPSDGIEPVPKGVNGADVVHRVYNRRGDGCGVIVWESKHTKVWNDVWFQKLKDDLRLVKGDVAVLVSETLPRGVESFTFVNGIWITGPSYALGVATALRMQLIEVATTKLATVGKNEKMEMLYRYLSGSEFKQRVEAIVEAFVEMQKDLQAERRTAERQWSKREKQIHRVIANTAGMYGDFQGIIGTSLQAIQALTAGEEDALEEASAALGAGAASDKIDEEDIDSDDVPHSLAAA